MANSLNDLYKDAPELFDKIITSWNKETISPQCRWIIKHGSELKIKELIQYLLINRDENGMITEYNMLRLQI